MRELIFPAVCFGILLAVVLPTLTPEPSPPKYEQVCVRKGDPTNDIVGYTWIAVDPSGPLGVTGFMMVADDDVCVEWQNKGPEECDPTLPIPFCHAEEMEEQ